LLIFIFNSSSVLTNFLCIIYLDRPWKVYEVSQITGPMFLCSTKVYKVSQITAPTFGAVSDKTDE